MQGLKEHMDEAEKRKFQTYGGVLSAGIQTCWKPVMIGHRAFEGIPFESVNNTGLLVRRRERPDMLQRIPQGGFGQKGRSD